MKEKLEVLIERFIKMRDVPRYKAESFINAMFDANKMLSMKNGYSSEQADQRVFEAMEDSLFNEYQQKKSYKTSSKKEGMKAGALIYMQSEKMMGRNCIYPGGLSRHLHITGIRKTPSGQPDARSVGDVLGKLGLGLKKNDDGSYPIPSLPEHFIEDEKMGVFRPSPEESTLEFLCKKYHIANVTSAGDEQ